MDWCFDLCGYVYVAVCVVPSVCVCGVLCVW